MQIIWVYIDHKRFFSYFNSTIEDNKIWGLERNPKVSNDLCIIWDEPLA
jgi:hypothetical protein